MKDDQARLAVLIDADNAHSKLADALFAEIAKYGKATTRRIYGNWTTEQLQGWKKILPKHAIQPKQQFANTQGKNATDSAMIIDAMDLLHTGRFDGFCIVSSDSDFTSLALRIREDGLTVYGFGERKTPEAFVAACDRFIYTDVLHREPEPGSAVPAKPDPAALKNDKRLVKLFRDAIEASSDEDGWAKLGGIGNHIANQAPEFDSRNYGFSKLRGLVTAIGLFEMEERPVGDGGRKEVYLRERKRR
ncbi:MAG TPA: NYN domain-containing protein [Solimonas sp.]|nr:NYN domain-containing protein [Solimonas sp.]